MRKPGTSFIFLPTVFIAGILFSLFGFARLLPQNAEKDRSDWMKDVADTTAIKDLDIPGSHDTLATYSIGNLAGQCQYMSLGEQLKAGIRFLDIRLQLDHNQLRAVHGFVDQKMPFQTANETITKFLSDHPKEFLIAAIKEEAAAKDSTITFKEALKQQLDPTYWAMDAEIPQTVGEVRGKAILLSRFDGNDYGVPAFHGWRSSGAYAIPNGIYIQDIFEVETVDEKKTAILDCFNLQCDSWRINYLTGIKKGSFPPSYAASIAKDINPWVSTILPQKGKRGIVVYDYVTDALMNPYFEGGAA